MHKSSQRRAYGETLLALCRENRNIVVLDADLGGSTMGKLVEQVLPEQHIEMGIAEANMASVAGGLARVGKIPFINSFAVFAGGRAYDQIRQSLAIGKLNVKICGSSAGVSDFGDGATHQSIDDLAYMRVIPNMTVLVPADAREAAAMTEYMAKTPGLMYLRVNRNDVPDLFDESYRFVPGQYPVMREGSDVCVFACGITVSLALAAAETLAGKVSVRVVNINQLKPMNPEIIAALCAGCRSVVTAEEHSVIGGLGGAIAESLSRTRMPVTILGVQDRFGSSAHSYEDALAYVGITQEKIEEAILESIQ